MLTPGSTRQSALALAVPRMARVLRCDLAVCEPDAKCLPAAGRIPLALPLNDAGRNTFDDDAIDREPRASPHDLARLIHAGDVRATRNQKPAIAGMKAAEIIGQPKPARHRGATQEIDARGKADDDQIVPGDGLDLEPGLAAIPAQIKAAQRHAIFCDKQMLARLALAKRQGRHLGPGRADRFTVVEGECWHARCPAAPRVARRAKHGSQGGNHTQRPTRRTAVCPQHGGVSAWNSGGGHRETNNRGELCFVIGEQPRLARWEASLCLAGSCRLLEPLARFRSWRRNHRYRYPLQVLI